MHMPSGLLIVLTCIAGSPSPAGVAEDCGGCNLYIVTYTGFYTGNDPIPGVTVSYTAGIGTANGACTGNGPCIESPCTYKRAKWKVSLAPDANPIMIGWNGHETELESGAVKEDVNRETQVTFGCGGAPLDLFTITTADDEFNVSLFCSACPGQAPY
jgi:hypothetical protein